MHIDQDKETLDRKVKRVNFQFGDCFLKRDASKEGDVFDGPFNGLFFQLLGYIRRQEAAAGIKSEGVLMDAGNSAVAAAAAGWVTTPIGARFIVCCSQTGSMVATSDHCVAIWADVVKTRLQVSGANAQVFAYKGYIDCGAILFWLQACHAAAL